MEKLKVGIAVSVVWVSLIALVLMGSNAYANNYVFAALPPGTVTMDVVKEDGMGSSGTFLCSSLKACYLKVLEAEYRGAHTYCKTITLKRDGRVVWHRDYSDPYWVSIQELKENNPRLTW